MMILLTVLQFHDINVNAADNDGWTALMIAAHHGLDGVVRQILQFHGINVNAATNDGSTALMLAS
ncbi:hypothetical protein CC2G_014509 [Coprinopsis cinerea AmutBmut pab1-1]|nr:hypothetical protein CC2G_014509 [Coprinopsis cinerea AmutBmut pab1-1]